MEERLNEFDYSVCYCNAQVENISDGLWENYKKLYYGYSENEPYRK